MVRSVLDVLTLMPIGHWGDVHDADGWRRLFGKLTHSPKQSFLCSLLLGPSTSHPKTTGAARGGKRPEEACCL